MLLSDVQFVFQWWAALFLVGVAAFPLTKKLFASWWDRGYFFGKAVGMAVVSYIVFLLGTLHILPFSQGTVFLSIGALVVFRMIISIFKFQFSNPKEVLNLKFQTLVENCNLKIENLRKKEWRIVILVLLEEPFFFLALFFWSWVKAHEPSIQGLEKFMDYGFMQSFLNSRWFPAPDMWWAGGFINYYFFGHLVTAVLTKLSGLDLSVTFNLMLATLFALTLTMSFSIGYQLSVVSRQSSDRLKADSWRLRAFISGLLTAFLVTLAGNMQTLYAFTKGYVGDAVVPFWTILWRLQDIGGVGGIWDGTLFGKLGEGMNRYWYANATRFIPFTIHEFPSYSFVVSDVHGHVLSLPFVLLAIGLLIVMFRQAYDHDDIKYKILNFKFIFKISHFIFQIGFYGFLLGVLLMTNALDGPIYFGVLAATFVISNIPPTLKLWRAGKNQTDENNSWWDSWRGLVLPIGIMLFVASLTALPFLIHFKSFAAGIGVNCPPGFLANTKIGPFLFEGVEKCQKSPLWMMELLWGFFWFTGVWLFVKNIWGKDQHDGPINRILKVFYLYGLVLIIIPEFFYVKDIYPAHFRSNTMFKLGYQAFILWSIVAAYTIVHFIFQRDSIDMGKKSEIRNPKSETNSKFKIVNYKTIRILFFLLLFPQLFLVSIYPIFSVRSYFGELKTYRGIYGLEWLEKELPDDFEAIRWLKQAVSRQRSVFRLSDSRKLTADSSLPVIVEADGESYTDYNHISAFSGVPTVVGWAVHEWLWRGSYDVVAPRREEVKTIYESPDSQKAREILMKYHVRYIIVGKLEREKYPRLDEARIASLGAIAFQSGETAVYEVGKTE